MLKRLCDICGAEIENSNPVFNIEKATKWYKIECIVNRQEIDESYTHLDVCNTCLLNAVNGEL